MKICVLIPVHNEAENLGALVCALKAKNLDVLVVDDGSTDDSSVIAKKQGAIALRNDQRRGKGFTLKEGFKYIIKENYDGVITIDGDGQHHSEDIDKFMKEAEANRSCIIIGNRMINSKDMPLVRYITNKVMSLVISLACRQKIPDTQCGFRYISSDILKALPLKCDRYEIETEILMKASKRKIVINSIPIKTIYGEEKSSISPFIDTIRFLVYFVKELYSKT